MVNANARQDAIDPEAEGDLENARRDRRRYIGGRWHVVSLNGCDPQVLDIRRRDGVP